MTKDKDIPFGALRIFVTVAESETLTEAGQRLGVTQSAVSQTISQLETLTQAQLVVRRSRPIKLTPSGQILKSHAEKILADARRMLADVQSASEKGLPNLTIGFIDSFGDVAGQQLLERLAPMVARISLQVGLTVPLSRALVNRDLDILVTSDPMDDCPNLARYPILRDPFVLLVPDRYYAGGSVTLEYLASEVAFVRYTHQLRLGALTELVVRRLNIEPNTRYEFDSTATLLRFVQAGHGWAIATGLCIVQHPTLLEGVHVMPLGNNANARYLSLFARDRELGDLPEKIAVMCREIYTEDVLPRTLQLAPWLENLALAIDELPAI